MDKNPKPATIYDVAELAGVSHITVSRVVNGKQNVSPETRERVQKAMEQLGYVPNLIAQTLQTRRSYVVEVVTTDIWGSDPKMLNTIGAIAGENGYQLSILPTTPEGLPNILNTIPNRMVAGTILYAQHIDTDYQMIQQLTRKHAFVHLGGRLHSNLPSVTYDQYYASTLAVQHLIDLGHREIAFIGGQRHLLDNLHREEAYLDTLRRRELPIGPMAYGNFGSDGGEQAAYDLLAQNRPFTAAFITSDAMAIGASYVFRQRGLRLPEDLSIVAYNNWEAAPYVVPPLTTVTNDLGLLANMAIHYLLEMIQNPALPRHQRVVTPELVIRESAVRR